MKTRTKRAPRRIVLQLASMLDMMLIVVFLQFLELRETSRAEAARAQQAQQDIEQQRDEIAGLRAEAEILADQALNQRDLVGQLTAELFNLPDDTIAKLLKARFPDDPPNDDEIAAMQQEFRKLHGRRGQEVVKHLLTFNELRKRCDVWELYVADTGVTTLTAGETEVSFRAETSKDFASHVFRTYRALPEAKSLVLIVLSYGDVREIYSEAAFNGLPLAIDRLQADAAGRSRFEYAVLGFDSKRAK